MRIPVLSLVLIVFCVQIATPRAFSSDISLPNFAQVNPGLYRGAAPTPAGIARLKSMGVTTIVDLRGGKEPAKEKVLVTGLGMKFVNLPMTSEPPTSKQIATLLAIANAAPGQRAFIHCQHGADRTGCMVGIYRVTHDHWPYAKAYAEMLHYGFKPYYTKLSETVRQASNR